jgi:hypothetical protein
MITEFVESSTCIIFFVLLDDYFKYEECTLLCYISYIYFFSLKSSTVCYSLRVLQTDFFVNSYTLLSVNSNIFVRLYTWDHYFNAVAIYWRFTQSDAHVYVRHYYTLCNVGLADCTSCCNSFAHSCAESYWCASTSTSQYMKAASFILRFSNLQAHHLTYTVLVYTYYSLPEDLWFPTIPTQLSCFSLSIVRPHIAMN